MIKILFVTLLFSSTVFAKTEKFQLVQDQKKNIIILKNANNTITIPTMFKIGGDLISAYTERSNNEVIIATIDKKNSTAELIVAKEKLEVNVIKNKTKNIFKAMTCSHMGCFPSPHFEKLDIQLLEITTSQGQIICWDQNNEQNRLEKYVLTQGHCLQ